MTLFLSFRYETVGGATRRAPVFIHCDTDLKFRSVGNKDVADYVAGRDLLICTHGYNNGQIAGTVALARLHERLLLPDTAGFLGILWPGDSHLGGVSYPAEKRTAEDTGRFLASYINKSLDDANSLSFASHSLGVRVILQAVRGIERRTRSATFMAAAIERDCLEAEYADAFARIDRVSVLASKGDRVLRGLFPIGNLFANILDPTAWPLSQALGFAGPPRALGNTVPPWLIDDQFGYDHGDYLPPGDPQAVVPQVGRFDKPVGFLRNTFLGQVQSWPPLGTRRPSRFG